MLDTIPHSDATGTEDSDAVGMLCVLTLFWLLCRRKKHIVIDLPKELTDLIMVYLAPNGPFNTICTKFNTARKYMFYDLKGRPMTTSQHMTLYWQQLLRAMDAPFNFPPHR